jgi:transaldolase
MAGYNGIGVIRQIRKMYDAFNIDTCIIAASIKSVRQVIQSVIAGAHSVAVTWPIFENMINHPMTQYGYEGFLETFKSIPKD